MELIIGTGLFICLGVVLKLVLDHTAAEADVVDNKNQQMALGVKTLQGRDRLF